MKKFDFVELEFVLFLNQDVISTSTGDEGAYATEEVYDAQNWK